MQQKTENKKTAEKALHEKVLNGTFSPIEAQLIEDWLATKTSVNEYGKKGLVLRMASIRKFLDAPLDSISSIEIMRAIPKIEKSTDSKNTRQGKLTTLKNFLEFRHHFGQEFENYQYMMRHIHPGTADIRAKKEEDLITRDQFSQIMAECPLNTQEKAFLMFVWDGYLRPSEAYTLRWCDIKTDRDGDRYYVITFKTEKPREIVLKPDTLTFLEVYRDEIKESWDSHSWIFPKFNGDRYTSLKEFTKLCKRITEKTGIHVKPSIFRNSAITEDTYHKSLQYISKRAWGDTLNQMINVYDRSDSKRIQKNERETEIKAIPKVLERSQSEMQKQIDDMQKVIEMLLKERNK